MEDIFDQKTFDVEHAITMYAHSFVTLPAFAIYEEKYVLPFSKQINDCHIYLVGEVPKLNLVSVEATKGGIFTNFDIKNQKIQLYWETGDELNLIGSKEEGWALSDGNGRRFFPSQDEIFSRLKEKIDLDFEVLYIGQAFGKDGARNAMDRLQRHETLQRISLTRNLQEHNLSVILIQIEPSTNVITMLNPKADQIDSDERIKNGLDKLYGTTESEQTTLYEASLIRYFRPEYNQKFKHSFPSTNMKVLNDCYDKDFSAVAAEIWFDDFPYRLFSKAVQPSYQHIAKHDLHTDEKRKIFFLG